MTEKSIPMFKVKPIEDMTLVEEVLQSGMTGEGPKVEQFSQYLRGVLGEDSIVCTNSCTSALVMALRMAGVEHRREVLTTPFTMIATNTAIKQAGGSPVFCDISRDTLCTDIDWLVKNFHDLINTNTRAVVITLVGGIVPRGLDLLYDMLPNNVSLILDAAHAFGTRYKEKPLSAYADFVCYSFQSIKHLSCGDGGALVCKDARNHNWANKLKWFGMSREIPEGKTRLEHQMTADVQNWGYKFHMNDVAAAIGLSNSKHSEEYRKKSVENAKKLDEGLNKICDVKIMEPEEQEPSWWVYPVRIMAGIGRNRVIQGLEKAGIQSSPMWKMNNTYSCFLFNGTRAKLNNTMDISSEILFLPSGWWVDDNDIDYIVENMKEIIK